jgi:predicted dinucleotide-binding enzyme
MTFSLNRRAILVLATSSILTAPLPSFAQTKRRIAIIGAGHIGGTVGALWVKAGHPVMFASRNPAELKQMVASLGPLAHAGTVAQAIRYADVILLAIPYNALPQLGTDNRAALKNKVVLDACNAVLPRDGDVAKQALAEGVGLASQKYLAGTHLVRAFNTLSYRILEAEADRPAPRLAIPIAGDDKHAVRLAEELVRDAGFDPVLVGGLDAARTFQQRGDPGYGQQVTAAELKQKLGLAS